MTREQANTDAHFEKQPRANIDQPVVARLEWRRGDRAVSSLLRNAGLGLTGASAREVVHITFKAGEVVDEDRVLRAVQSMIDQSNKESADFEITCPRVLSIN